MNLIDGKQISAQIRKELADKAKELKDQTGIVPGLAVIIVGEDPASQIYVRNKAKACEELGFYSEVIRMSADTTQSELEELIDRLNENNKIHGILLQLPLPKNSEINESEILLRISPKKDVDAFHPYNVGLISIGDYGFLPCTPAGVMQLIERSGIEVCGKSCVVIGRSNIVGKPMAMLLLNKSGTVTVCHSRTKNLKEICASADILVSAVGKAGFVTADMVKDGAVVIDVGMNRDANGKLCGDVAFDEVAPKTSYITPVPGGVGPMTITMLMRNTLYSAEQSAK